MSTTVLEFFSFVSLLLMIILFFFVWGVFVRLGKIRELLKKIAEK